MAQLFSLGGYTFMKKYTPIILILLLIIGASAAARAILPWTEAKMQEASDLIVVGTLTQVQDLDETNSALWPSPQLWPAADPARQERLDGRTTRDDAMTLAFNERAVRDDFEAK